MTWSNRKKKNRPTDKYFSPAKARITMTVDDAAAPKVTYWPSTSHKQSWSNQVVHAWDNPCTMLSWCLQTHPPKNSRQASLPSCIWYPSQRGTCRRCYRRRKRAHPCSSYWVIQSCVSPRLEHCHLQSPKDVRKDLAACRSFPLDWSYKCGLMQGHQQDLSCVSWTYGRSTQRPPWERPWTCAPPQWEEWLQKVTCHEFFDFVTSNRHFECRVLRPGWRACWWYQPTLGSACPNTSCDGSS